MSAKKEKLTCDQRIDIELEKELENIRALWEAYCSGEEEVEDLGNIYEYGLCFDYVSSDTFDDQEEGYFRYQISWGGPSDEFRFYTDAEFNVYKVEYWFMDWFDGASRRLYNEDKGLMVEVFEWFKEVGTVQHVFDKAMDY